MARRLTRKPRQACPLAPTGVACHAFGREGDCQLCALVDLDHPVSAVTLGQLDGPQPAGDPEEAFWAHLARRSDGGPTTPEHLARWIDRLPAWKRAGTQNRIRAAVAARSDLPTEAPF